MRKGEPLFAVETDKVKTDVEAPADGVLTAIFVAEGERADVGQPLAELQSLAGATPAQPQPAPPSTLTPMRRRIAERMTEARATIAQGSCAQLVDLSKIERAGRSWTPYFVRALGVVLDAQRIGVAVEISEGLVVPVVANAASGTLDAIAAATVTNVGGSGTLLAFPLVAPGESAILAPGTIVEGRCWLALCYDRAQFNEYSAERLLSRVIDNLTIERHSEGFT